MKFTRIQLRTR